MHVDSNKLYKAKRKVAKINQGDLASQYNKL